MTYVRFIEDTRGDVVDVQHFCSPTCFYVETGQEAGGHRWPCPEQADYDQHCPVCGALTVPGIHEEEDEVNETETTEREETAVKTTIASPVIATNLNEYGQTAYVVGFGDGVRSWVTGDHGEDVALDEARSWHADQAYIDGWRNGREWAKGKRG